MLGGRLVGIVEARRDEQEGHPERRGLLNVLHGVGVGFGSSTSSTGRRRTCVQLARGATRCDEVGMEGPRRCGTHAWIVEAQVRNVEAPWFAVQQQRGCAARKQPMTLSVTGALACTLTHRTQAVVLLPRTVVACYTTTYRRTRTMA